MATRGMEEHSNLLFSSGAVSWTGQKQHSCYRSHTCIHTLTGKVTISCVVLLFTAHNDGHAYQKTYIQFNCIFDRTIIFATFRSKVLFSKDTLKIIFIKEF